MTRIYPLILLALSIAVPAKSDTSVHILGPNLEQVVTSTTLQWVSSNGLNETMLENAVVAAYQIMEDPNDSQDAGNTISSKPVYVCRAKANSIWVSGQLRPKKLACIVSMYKKVAEYVKFEVLINIEGSSRLSWVYRNQYNLLPQGAVSCGEDTLRTFVARRTAKNHNKRGSLTYHVGKLNPSENLGVYDVVDQNNQELQFEDGEILVETEPISYELKSIKFDRLRSRHSRKPVILGQAILKNTESSLQRVDTVISYTYNYSLFWGKGHGLLTGLPFTVHLNNGTNLAGEWALPDSGERVDTRTIEKYLEEGTAVNVTLLGNDTESDVPYTALVVALYADKERKERILSDSKREHSILDVYPEFGPVYYIHNNSHVPTTTTTTTTTTSTTTTKTTSTTQDASPIVPPHIADDNSITKKKEESSSSKKHENSSNMMSDDSDALSLKKNTKDHSSASRPVTGLVALFVVAVVLRVT